jgi:hypothetical protein
MWPATAISVASGARASAISVMAWWRRSWKRWPRIGAARFQPGEGLAGVERLLCGLSTDAPGGFADQFPPSSVPTLLRGVRDRQSAPRRLGTRNARVSLLPRALARSSRRARSTMAAVQQKWFGDRLRFCYAGSLRLGRRDPPFSRVRAFQITRIPSLRSPGRPQSRWREPSFSFLANCLFCWATEKLKRMLPERTEVDRFGPSVYGNVTSRPLIGREDAARPIGTTPRSSGAGRN